MCSILGIMVEGQSLILLGSIGLLQLNIRDSFVLALLDYTNLKVFNLQ